LDDRSRDAGVFGATWPGANKYCIDVERFYLVEGEGIVAVNKRFGP
jgi:hypothetical protein